MEGWLSGCLAFKSATELGQELGKSRSLLGLGQALQGGQCHLAPNLPAGAPLSLPRPQVKRVVALVPWAGQPWHILGPWGGIHAVPLGIPMLLECP